VSAFIVLEGLDGAGTTTQLERLAGWLETRGQAVVRTHEPTDGPIGRVIRASLRAEDGAPAMDTLPWLFAADRADHLSRLVEPSLASGAWVLSDRYLHSSLAYQSLTLPLEDVYALNKTFRAPDLTIFVELPVDTCLERILARGGTLEIYERRDRLERIARAYDAVLEHLQARGDAIVRVDGRGSIELVHERIRSAVASLS
jgi:dTMP kinase